MSTTSGNYNLNNLNKFDYPSSNSYPFLLDTNKITNPAFATAVKFNNLDVLQSNPNFNAITFTDVNDLNKKLLNIKNNYNKENTGVLEAINQMKNNLKENNVNNFRFMTNLSMNIKYFANVLDNIKNNVLKIFSLIEKLNINLIVNPPIPPGVPPGTTPENYDNLINELVNTINVYLKQFNLLSSMIQNVKLNDTNARTELLSQSNSLFEKISSLETTFDNQFKKIGIFSVKSGNDKILMTYRQIRTIIANSKKFNQTIKDYFNKKYDPNQYIDIQRYIDSIPNHADLVNPSISGGSKQIKRTKNKHKKTRKHLSKRRKAFRSKRA
jgi:hypothetical protein